MSTRLDGARRLTKTLRRLAADLAGEAARAVPAIAARTAADARRLAPEDEGELDASIEARPVREGAEIVADSDHAAYVEFGTRHAPRQPFMRPAARKARRRAKGLIRDLRKIARSA